MIRARKKSPEGQATEGFAVVGWSLMGTLKRFSCMYLNCVAGGWRQASQLSLKTEQHSEPLSVHMSKEKQITQQLLSVYSADCQVC